MSHSYLVVALHGHLPWVNHPEHEFFLEEDWLFEAIADCYLPLLLMLDGWARDGVQASFTMGLSPPLLSMLSRPNLQSRALRALEARRTLLVRYLRDLPADDEMRSAALWAREETEAVLGRFLAAGLNLPHAFAHHASQGRVDLMTCGATHGLFPVLLDEGSWRAQVDQAVRTHEQLVGLKPNGIWLPECGIAPSAFRVLAEYDLQYTFGEDRSVRFAWPPPVHDVFRPVFTPEGVAVFPRDPNSAREVWSSIDGYPGDFRYREFYRDLGFDADEEILDPVHKQGTGGRKQLGVKLHRITGKVALGAKDPYDPHAASQAIDEHVRHFAAQRSNDAVKLANWLGTKPCITSAFDAELFGHWWHEGPRFLDGALRALAAAAQRGEDAPQPISATAYLEQEPTQQVVYPSVSSWGDAGAFAVWVNQNNDWVWRKIHDVRLRLGAAVRRLGSQPGGLYERALKQATREVMLAQSSDWPFILTMGTQTGYAGKRPVVHMARAHRLLWALEQDHIDENDLAQMEERDGLFPDVAVRHFA